MGTPASHGVSARTFLNSDHNNERKYSLYVSHVRPGDVTQGNCFVHVSAIQSCIAELDYLVEDIYCYSEFHAPCGAIIRQLLKITDTYEDIQNLKIQNNA